LGRETVRLALDAENIEARPVWKPMHLQPVFQVERLKAEGSKLKAGENGPQVTPVPSAGATGQARINSRPDEIEKKKALEQ